MDEADVAAALYPTTADTASPAPMKPAIDADNERRAAAIFSSMAPVETHADEAPNAAVAEVRAMDGQARAMFKDVDQWGGAADGSGGLVRDLAVAVREAFPDVAGQGDMGKQVAGLASVFVDIGADHALVREMTSIVKAGGEVDRGEVVKQLQTQYGDDFNRKLADAQKLVNRDPRLATFLVKTGLGDNPQVIRRMVELAAAQRSAGRLK